MIKLSALKSAIIRDLLVVDRAATVMEAIALLEMEKKLWQWLKLIPQM
jgi:hypothetical protein